MRTAILAITALAACYSPQLKPCSIHCTGTEACPDDLTCQADHFCHAPDDAAVCPTKYAVSVQKAGSGAGRVTSAQGTDCGAVCTTLVSAGAQVTLAATPDPGSLFAGWSGACTADPCTLVVTSDVVVGATFDRSAELDVSFVGAGVGNVTSVPAGIDCTADCAASYAVNTSVTLTATPDVASTFIGWENGPCTGIDPCTLTLTALTQVTAHFE